MEADVKEKLKHVPAKPGAYMMKDDRGDVIYVGKAASLRSRVRSYFQKGHAHGPKELAMLSRVTDVDWIATDSEVEALMLECNLIKKYRPRYNVRLRDDKHYPYLCVTVSEPFPRVLVVRRVKKDGNRYFGPYADASALRDSVRFIRRAFRVRGCNKKLAGGEQDRPCLNLHLNQCDSPCSGRITQQEYAELVRDTCTFLEGRQEALAAHLEREMQAAAERLEFERAARIRDRLESVRKLIEKQKVISTDLVDQDVIAITSDGGSACVQLLFVRSGKLIGEEHFFLEGATDETAEASLGEFIKQYYRDAAYVPKTILVSHVPVETAVLVDWLSLKRGAKVTLAQPKRGAKRRLVEMAAENAALAAERERSGESKLEEEALADLESLREALDLPEPPARIEAYDISNIQGREAVGSMVVFQNGKPAKSQYRRFKIRVGDQPDDYAMMREVLMRRFARARNGDPKFASLPDLVLVDGGRGQLNAALEAMAAVRSQETGDRRQKDSHPHTHPPAGEVTLEPCAETLPRPPVGEGRGEGSLSTVQAEGGQETGDRSQKSGEESAIPVVSLAKRLEEIHTPQSSEPVLLPRESPALRLLQRIRDEAHRFALAYHHKLRQKAAKKSVLDSISGIGETRRKALIRKFGSLAGVKRASLEDLLAVPGMTRTTAQAVYDALHV